MNIDPYLPPFLQIDNQQQTTERSCPCVPYLPRSIKGKLVVSLLIISLLGITATFSANYAIWRIQDKIQIIESFFELNQNVLEMRRYEKNYLLYNNKEDLISTQDYIDKVRDSLNQVQTSLVAARKLFPGSEQNLQIFLVDELGKYESISLQLMAEDLLLASRRQLKETLRTHGQDITKWVFDMDTKARVQVELEVVTYQKIATRILVLASLVGGILIYFLVRWIMRPLTAIREAAAQIMQSKMNFIPINEAVSCSEEGVELVNSLNLMLKAIDTKQSQLVQSEKLAAIGKVTAGIAHEINNPLNNISLTAETLLEDLPNLDCSERMEMVRDILIQSDRAREVVHHLLEFSRAHKNSATVMVDLVKLMTDSIALVRNQFRLGEITCNYQPPSEPVQIIGTPPQLQQVLVNIMLNAVQAMQPGGQLDIGITEEDQDAVITITDTGAGIPSQLLPRIFDPFFTTKNEGTGLGLSLSYSIVKDHHGDIEVESEEGHGTTFRIKLPQAA